MINSYERPKNNVKSDELKSYFLKNPIYFLIKSLEWDFSKKFKSIKIFADPSHIYKLSKFIRQGKADEHFCKKKIDPSPPYKGQGVAAVDAVIVVTLVKCAIVRKLYRPHNRDGRVIAEEIERQITRASSGHWKRYL